MSDDANQYYKPWVNSFGNEPKQLLCNWHLDRSWRSQLRKIGDSNIESQVHKQLKVLMEEPDKLTFERLLEGSLCELRKLPKTREFAKYFEKAYVASKEQWALCFCTGSGISTNMFVEAFHRVLKYDYLKGTVNRRLDTLVCILLRVAKDKAFDHSRISLKMKPVAGLSSQREASYIQSETNCRISYTMLQYYVQSMPDMHTSSTLVHA